MPEGYVYILSSQTRVLYVGMTNDLQRRMYEHKSKAVEGFTAKYNVNQLVYYEQVADVSTAVRRETQLKGWTRAKKISFIEQMNPHWFDLSDRWYESDPVADIFAMPGVHLRSRPDPSTSASTPALRMKT